MATEFSAREKLHESPRKLRKCLFVLFVTATLCGCLTAAVLQLNATYHGSVSLGQAGEQHLSTAVKLLEDLRLHPGETSIPGQARQEFSAALADFVAIQNNVELSGMGAVGGIIPVYGGRVDAAIHLVSLAIDFSQAGIDGSAILAPLLVLLQNPLNASGQTLTYSDMRSISDHIRSLVNWLNAAINEAGQLKPGDIALDAQVSKLIDTFISNIPTIRLALSQVEQVLPILPTLMGIEHPAQYLIEIMDAGELRPTGGFIGNYGVLTIDGGRALPLHITDVDLLDKPFSSAGLVIPYPPAYVWFSHYLAGRTWSLRDSNLDADFPTAALAAETNYKIEGGTAALQGVIAITPGFIQQILTITGPVYVPTYHETITAQNLVDRIHYHQLGNAGEGSDLIPSPDGYSSLRKRFTAYLAEDVMARVQQMAASMPRFVEAFVSALHTKDIQVYMNAGAAEGVLRAFGLADTLQAPASDSLFIVDANVGDNKANTFITNTVDDNVTIDSSGNALHHATLQYAWNIPGNVYGSSLYKDYVRVYVPPGSVLLSQQGWHPFGTSSAFGREVWAGSFTLVYGQHITITLAWRVPGVARRVGVSGDTWQYAYLHQRQAAKVEHFTIQIALPSGMRVKSESPHVIAARQKQVLALTLAQLLAQDLQITIGYGI